MESGRSGTFEYADYDEIYPPGPGKAVAEQVCMACHGENFFPTRPGTERQWETWIDHMVGSTLAQVYPFDRPFGRFWANFGLPMPVSY